MWTTNRLIFRGVVVAVLLVQVGCATRSIPVSRGGTAVSAPAVIARDSSGPDGTGDPSAASSALMPEPGEGLVDTLGVVASPTTPTVRHWIPSTAKAGAQSGMRTGATVLGAVPAVLCMAGAYTVGGLVFCPAALAAMGVGALLGAPVGALVGAMKRPSVAAIRSADAALAGIVAELAVQQALRDQVFQTLRRETSHWSVLMAASEHVGGEAGDRPRAYAAPGIDTILELRVVALEVAGPFGVDLGVPPIVLSGRARLIRASDGMLMRAREIAWRGGSDVSFREWPRDAPQLRDVLNQAYRDIARDLAGWLGAPSPAPVEAGPPSEG